MRPRKQILLRAYNAEQMSLWRMRIELWGFRAVTEEPCDAELHVGKKGITVAGLIVPIGEHLAQRVLERCKNAVARKCKPKPGLRAAKGE